MHFGISTACFYPKETYEALQELGTIKMRYAEVFINSFCELLPEYIARLSWQAKNQNTQLLALHPFSCEMESFFFGSDYPARVLDGTELYKKYFSACRMLDIKKTVFHGINAGVPYPFEKHVENYINLRKIAADYGVDFCYENVVRCKCASPEYITKLRELCKDDVSFVLDVKQMRRAGVPTTNMLQAMHGKIAHIHLSDYNEKCDCITPGTGDMDTKLFFKELIKMKFNGDIIVELYQNGYASIEELAQCVKDIKKLYKEMELNL